MRNKDRSNRVNIVPPEVPSFVVTIEKFYDILLLFVTTRPGGNGVWTTVGTVAWVLKKLKLITAKAEHKIPDVREFQRLLRRNTLFRWNSTDCVPDDTREHFVVTGDSDDSHGLCSTARLFVTDAGRSYAESIRDKYPVPWQEVHAWRNEYKRLHELRKTGQLNKEIDEFFEAGKY